MHAIIQVSVATLYFDQLVSVIEEASQVTLKLHIDKEVPSNSLLAVTF